MHQLFTALNLPQDHRFRNVALNNDSGIGIEKAEPGSRKHADILDMQVRLSSVNRDVTPAELRAWMLPLLSGLKFGAMRESADLTGRTDAIVLAFERTPAFVFTGELQRECLKRFEYFPTASEIWKMIEPTVAQFERARSLLNQALGRRYDTPLVSIEQAHQERLGGGTAEPAVRLVVSAPVAGRQIQMSD